MSYLAHGRHLGTPRISIVWESQLRIVQMIFMVFQRALLYQLPDGSKSEPSSSSFSFCSFCHWFSCVTDCLSSWYAFVSIKKDKNTQNRLIKYLPKTWLSIFGEPTRAFERSLMRNEWRWKDRRQTLNCWFSSDTQTVAMQQQVHHPFVLSLIW